MVDSSTLGLYLVYKANDVSMANGNLPAARICFLKDFQIGYLMTYIGRSNFHGTDTISPGHIDSRSNLRGLWVGHGCNGSGAALESDQALT
jgi:hypothetical protein